MSEISKRLTILLGAAALAGGGVAAAQGGYGQQQGQQGGNAQNPAQQQSPQGAEDFSDEQIQSFVEAKAEVDSINQEFQEKMQNAEDPAKVSEMRQKANQQMVQTVQSAGLEPAQYNAIARAVRNDSELQEKVESME